MAVLVVLTFPDQATVTPYLVIPALIGAADRGRAGLLRVIATESGLLLVAWVLVEQRWDREFAASCVHLAGHRARASA